MMRNIDVSNSEKEGDSECFTTIKMFSLDFVLIQLPRTSPIASVIKSVKAWCTSNSESFSMSSELHELQDFHRCESILCQFEESRKTSEVKVKRSVSVYAIQRKE